MNLHLLYVSEVRHRHNESSSLNHVTTQIQCSVYEHLPDCIHRFNAVGTSELKIYSSEVIPRFGMQFCRHFKEYVKLYLLKNGK